MSQRGIKYALNKYGIRAQRGVFDNGGDASPIWPTVHMSDVTTAPTATQVSGDMYQNAGRLYVSNGSVYTPGGVGVVKTAATTLTAADNGATCFFNSAAGDIYTLPAPVVGLEFEFVVLVTITSNAAKVITDAASTFLLGGFIQSTDGTYTSAFHAANGTTIRAISMNGTTTGGLQGDWWKVKCITATQWAIWGMGRATGTEATPFATS